MQINMDLRWIRLRQGDKLEVYFTNADELWLGVSWNSDRRQERIRDSSSTLNVKWQGEEGG